MTNKRPIVVRASICQLNKTSLRLRLGKRKKCWKRWSKKAAKNSKRNVFKSLILQSTIIRMIVSSNKYSFAKLTTYKKFKITRCSSKKTWNETRQSKRRKFSRPRRTRLSGTECVALSLPNSEKKNPWLQPSQSPRRSQCHQQVQERSVSILQQSIVAGHRLGWKRQTTLLTIKCPSMVPRR